MRINDFDEVSKCVEILKRIERAEKDVRECLNNPEQVDQDPGGIPDVAQEGFFCHLSRMKDGSGAPVDLTGCYVGKEVYESTLEILQLKKDEILGHLVYLGVDTSEY